ncbi:diaminopimelate epimerase [Methanocaldococcus infernus ME]|uniref:Diaminopimelate epimerase n=2 Tax=Methanocaldococcus infernus TaxID=67760 RepID=D5VQQ0_METIM|nr:diaminopimelate epimerase [Methanocaldococcus infernus ME]
MHALGNDYIVINEFDGEKVKNKEEFSKKVCRRRFSIGADGVIFIQKPSSNNYDVKFRIFNSDGSEAEMCGNGIRCFSKYVYERILKKNPLKVETKAGLRVCELEVEDDRVKKIRVYMGKPSFKCKDIPVKSEKEEFINERAELKNPYLKEVNITAVSVGNPHAIIFVDDLEKIREHLDVIGSEIENLPIFPERINVHFVKVLNDKEIKILTWERGVGYTMACGTGATASAVVSNRLGFTKDKVLVHLDGGDLEIEIKDDGAYMKGDAVMVYDGVMFREAYEG